MAFCAACGEYIPGLSEGIVARHALEDEVARLKAELAAEKDAHAVTAASLIEYKERGEESYSRGYADGCENTSFYGVNGNGGGEGDA